MFLTWRAVAGTRGARTPLWPGTSRTQWSGGRRLRRSILPSPTTWLKWSGKIKIHTFLEESVFSGVVRVVFCSRISTRATIEAHHFFCFSEISPNWDLRTPPKNWFGQKRNCYPSMAEGHTSRIMQKRMAYTFFFSDDSISIVLIYSE